METQLEQEAGQNSHESQSTQAAAPETTGDHWGPPTEAERAAALAEAEAKKRAAEEAERLAEEEWQREEEEDRKESEAELREQAIRLAPFQKRVDDGDLAGLADTAARVCPVLGEALYLRDVHWLNQALKKAARERPIEMLKFMSS